MKVIKVVLRVWKNESEDRLISTYAKGVWQKEYVKGKETKPSIGYLFAYPEKSIKQAKKDIKGISYHFWLAEAKVVGKISSDGISILYSDWKHFWEKYKLRIRLPVAEYLLCSSITLIEELK